MDDDEVLSSPRIEFNLLRLAVGLGWSVPGRRWKHLRLQHWGLLSCCLVRRASMLTQLCRMPRTSAVCVATQTQHQLRTLRAAVSSSNRNEAEQL
jgi:hypothetical protein